LNARPGRRILPLLALCAVLLPALPAAAARHAVDQWITAFAHRIKGHETRALRQTVVGDIDGDGRPDVAVLFTIAGVRLPDDELQFVAVFHRGAGHRLTYVAHRLVGGRGIREANRVVVLDRQVVLEILAYRAGDGLCCPSRPERLRYRLRRHELVEVTAAGQRAHRHDAARP
jgi:hypothetical protein